MIPSSGFSLLEVLIALAVVTSALLGMIAFQSAALREIYIAYQQSAALAEAGAMMERLRANISPSARERELNLWQREIQLILPSGTGDYECSSALRLCTVNIHWHAHGPQTFSLSSLI